MPTKTAASGRTGRPPVTSRAQILAAAHELIDRDGWEKLTIRGLAAELGIGATTLYHHVRDKDDLLVRLLNDYAERTPRPRLPEDPAGRITAAAMAIHEALSIWPWASQVLAADRLVPEGALWYVEAILEAAHAAGCGPEQSMYVYRSIWYYTAGEILVRGRPQGDGGPDRDQVIEGVDPAEFPRLSAIGDRWATLASRDTYAEGLRAFVHGLLAQATQADR